MIPHFKVFGSNLFISTLSIYLLFNNISSSFVIAYLEKDVVGISGRNLNKVNVGEILTKLGGGGNEYEAACNIKGKNIKEVKKELIEILK